MIHGLLTILMVALMANPTSFYDFKVDNIDGKPVDLKDYKGKVVLVVNVASKCGYTGQYEDLEALYQKYKEKGLVILGFPANNFGGQEPGSNAEIKTFCSSKYNVTFPMFSKVSVKGNDQAELFTFLTKQTNPDFTGDIKWNFEKFLIGQDGKLIHRYRSGADPLDDDLEAAIKEALK